MWWNLLLGWVQTWVEFRWLFLGVSSPCSHGTDCDFTEPRGKWLKITPFRNWVNWFCFLVRQLRSSYLFKATALLLVVGVVGELEVLGYIFVTRCLLDAQLLSQPQDLLLELCDGLPRTLGVERRILWPRLWAVRIAQRCLSQTALQPLDLKQTKQIRKDERMNPITSKLHLLFIHADTVKQSTTSPEVTSAVSYCPQHVSPNMTTNWTLLG